MMIFLNFVRVLKMIKYAKPTNATSMIKLKMINGIVNPNTVEFMCLKIDDDIIVPMATIERINPTPHWIPVKSKNTFSLLAGVSLFCH